MELARHAAKGGTWRCFKCGHTRWSDEETPHCYTCVLPMMRAKVSAELVRPLAESQAVAGSYSGPTVEKSNDFKGAKIRVLEGEFFYSPTISGLSPRAYSISYKQ